MPRTRVCGDRTQRQPVDGAHRARKHKQRRAEHPGADRPDDQPDDGRHRGAADSGGGDLEAHRPRRAADPGPVRRGQGEQLEHRRGRKPEQHHPSNGDSMPSVEPGSATLK